MIFLVLHNKNVSLKVVFMTELNVLLKKLVLIFIVKALAMLVQMDHVNGTLAIVIYLLDAKVLSAHIIQFVNPSLHLVLQME